MIYKKIEKVFQMESKTFIEINSYIKSYPSLIGFFKDKEKILSSDLIVGAHMVYGWMPTIVNLNCENINDCVKIANKAKASGKLSKDDIEKLSKFINNSVVGASKILHFINPNIFPIWDSKIYKFIYNETPHGYRVNDAKKYINYMEEVNNLKNHREANNFIYSLNGKIGYDVSIIRGIELVMFINQPE